MSESCKVAKSSQKCHDFTDKSCDYSQPKFWENPCFRNKLLQNEVKSYNFFYNIEIRFCQKVKL